MRRYRKLIDKIGKDLQVDFTYERLPFFCLACGIMGHAEKDCHFVLDEDKCEKLGWNLSLKATLRKGRNKEMEEEMKLKHCKKILFEKHSENVMQVRSDLKENGNSPCTNPITTCVLAPVPHKDVALKSAASDGPANTPLQILCSLAPQHVDPPFQRYATYPPIFTH